MSAVAELEVRAVRVALLAAFIDTIESTGQRVDVIGRLLKAGIIAPETSELLLCEFVEKNRSEAS